MDAVRILLRLFHIFGGTIWVGAAFFMTLFVEPTVRAAGAEGGRFMDRLVTQTILVKYMTVAALLTVITGVVLYGIDSGFTLDWIVSREGQIFTIGSLAGLLAYATGQFVISPTSQRIGALGRQMAMGGGPPTALQVNEMAALQSRAGRFGRLEVVLMAITVLGMAGARVI